MRTNDQGETQLRQTAVLVQGIVRILGSSLIASPNLDCDCSTSANLAREACILPSLVKVRFPWRQFALYQEWWAAVDSNHLPPR